MLALYFTPKEAIGCANRGLAALGLAFLSLAASFVMTALALARRSRSREESLWFILSAILFVLPAALLLGPLR